MSRVLSQQLHVLRTGRELAPHYHLLIININIAMSSDITETQTAVTKKQKKLKPARKQVKPGEVEKKEAPQTGKEYSAYWSF